MVNGIIPEIKTSLDDKNIGNLWDSGCCCLSFWDPRKRKKTSCKEAMCFFKLKLEPHGNASHEQLTRSWFQPIPGIMPVRYEVKPVTWAFECPTFPATAADIGPGNKKLLGTTAELQTNYKPEMLPWLPVPYIVRPASLSVRGLGLQVCCNLIIRHS